jgi:hypothetical protein
MKIQRSALVRLALALVVALSLPGIAQARPQTAAELYVYPAEGARGAVLTLSAFNLWPELSFQFVIAGAGIPEPVSLGSFVTDPNGNLAATTTLPDLPAGNYVISIFSADYPAATLFTVLPATALTLDPTSGPPGTVVNFSVSNLVAGSLRLDYAGSPVLGPLAVGPGTYSGSFTVPRNRPANLGDPVMVEATSLAAGRTVASASAEFISQPPPAPTAYQLTDVRLPTSPVSPGQIFTVSGVISPPPSGPLTDYNIKVLWKTAAGKVFPITSGAPTLLESGSFQASAILPSLLNGDPQPAEQGGQVGVVFGKSNKPPEASFYTPFGDFPSPKPFRILVQDTQGHPIPNAIVDLRGDLADYTLQLVYSKPDGSQASVDVFDLTTQPNQYLSFGNGVLFPSETDPFNCAPSPVYGRTDANGIFQPALALNDWLALAGKKVSLGPSYPGAYLVNPTEITFSVSVTGQYQGFGQVANKVPIPWSKDILYRAVTGSFYEVVNGQNVPLNTDPLVVTLAPLPPGTPLEQPIALKMPGAKPLSKIDNWLGSGSPLTAFGTFAVFTNPAIFPNSLFVNPNFGLVVSFDHDAALYGALDQSSITLTINNQVYPFQAITSDQCGTLTYRATIPAYFRMAAGNYVGLVEVKDMANPPNITKRYIQLNMVNAPAWFADTSLVNRSVMFYYNYAASIKGSVLAPGSPASNSTLDASLNKVGPVGNSAGATGTYEQYLSTSGAGTRKFLGSVNYSAMNTPDSKDISQDATTNTPITFQDGPITILDTGKFPLFRDTWGLDPIAGATIGADMWFKGTLTYNGSIQFQPGGATSYTVTVHPQATVGVDAWLDARALFGLVEAEAHAIPKISMDLPVTFQNGVKIDATKCFKYRLDIAWSASVGYCPFCLSDSGTENIFAGHTPDPSPYCSDPTFQAQAAAATPPLPAASPSLAVDGVGGVLAVWRADDGTIQFSRYDGVQWLAPGMVSLNTSSGAPAVAYYAPGKAMAVWTQNGLTPLQSQPATFAERVLNQHLAYATWDGAAWSAPQNLTLPTTGDGGVTLAGCLSTNPACPAGGAVTAAWVHDAAGDLNQHQLRLLYASYHNGAWDAAQPVDSTSTATDSEPTLTYQNGAPVLAWVRDADRDLGTLGDRKLAYRGLAGPSAVTEPADLPAGVVEPSLAADPAGNLRLVFTLATDAGGLSGNQRQLYSAAQSCSGTCAWVVLPLVDWHGRAIFAEGPKLTLDGAGKGTIIYRGLGMGALPGGGKATFKEDAPGIIQGTGEVSQVTLDFTSAAVTPAYLTQDGLNKWQMSSVYDSLTGQTLVTAAMAGGGLLAQATTAAPLAIAQGQPVIALSAPDLPDYAIDTAVPSATILPTGTPLSVEVGVVNRGSGGEQRLLVEAAWDGPPGSGLPAGATGMIGPAVGQLASASLSIDTSGVDLSQPHQLYVAINPYQEIAEGNFENNLSVIEIGGLPVPVGLAASARPGSSLVFLSWNASLDERVVGYRIYRFDAYGNGGPVGNSFEPDFADLFASLGASYHYAVTSFDEQGQESALSSSVEVNPVWLNIYIPLLQQGR